MSTVGTAEREAAEDVFFGQVVIIWARWFLIVAGAVLASGRRTTAPRSRWPWCRSSR